MLLVAAASAYGQAPAPVELLRTDSRAPFVHRIGLYDAQGAAIDPTQRGAAPYSPTATCGKCHEVGTISHGWHFNAAEAGADRGRPGEPWVRTDPAIGLQIPLSYRAWPGTHTPQALGLTDWDFALRFGRHLPGGGPGNPDATRDPPGLSRWPLAGGLEIDCMLCHCDDNRHDQSERARQIERENLRWIPTVSMGLAVVRGDTSRLPDDFDPSMGPNPDFPEQQPPRLEYDRSKFDADHRVLFNITRRPSADRCLFCHSVREVGEGAPQPWHTDQDVHLRAGMRCVDCHRNGIDHLIVRGYEGEAHRGERAAATLTCRGCHLGESTTAEVLVESTSAQAGRLGAPVPRHAGLPAYHLEEMSCTACHSGPVPAQTARRFQTSLSHALGVPTRTRGDLDDPAIVGPVLLKDINGLLTPHRLLRPAFWAVRSAEGIRPLEASKAAKAVRKALADAGRNARAQGPLEPEQIKAGLAALKSLQAEGSEPVYVGSERVYALAADGALVETSDPAAAPYAWPLAHDVRPAAQSLGAGGCADCHADDAPLYAGQTVDASVSRTAGASTMTMLEARRADAGLARAWNRSMRWRETFKVAAFIGVGVVAWLAVARGLVATGDWLRRR